MPITDLGAADPASEVTDTFRAGKWRKIPYEAEGFSGTMLYALGDQPGEEVRVRLNVSGWHDIYLGLYAAFLPTILRCRLSAEPCHQKFRLPPPGPPERSGILTEVHWKAAELTEQAIHFRRVISSMSDSAAAVAFVRLVPLRDDQVRQIQHERQRTDTKRLAAMNDGHGIFWEFGLKTRDELREEVDIYAQTDFKRLYWEFICGDRCTFPTRVGSRRLAEDMDACAFPRRGDRLHMETIKSFFDRGLDLLAMVRELTRDAGLELFAGQRVNGCVAQPPWTPIAGSEFYEANLHLRCLHADGEPVDRMSYAYPEVRQHIIDIFREIIEYGVDGIELHFIRGVPLVMYEQPMLDRFRERYGDEVDPHSLPVEDERVFSVRAELLTEYLRELRAAIDEAAASRRLPRPKLSAMVLCNEQANRHFGLDVPTWCSEGLLDVLIASNWGTQWAGDVPKAADGVPDRDMDYFARCVEGTGCELLAEILAPGTWRVPATHYLQRAEAYYKGGADGLAFWDTYARHMESPDFEILRTLGHRDDLPQRIKSAAATRREVPLRTIDGMQVRTDRYPSWLCF